MTLFKNRSLRFRLIIVISIASLFIWLLSTSVAWFQVRKEVDKMFDTQQILFAQRLASSNLHTLLVDRRMPKEFRREFRRETDGKAFLKKHFKQVGYDDDALAFAVFNRQGEMLLHDGSNGEFFPFSPKPNNFSRDYLNDVDDEAWRIFWLPVAGGNLIIAVGQEIDYRDDIIEEMVIGQMWVWFISLPLLLILIVWVINHELKALRQVGEEVKRRTPDDSSPITTDVPKEISPLVQSLNQFFDKTSTMLLRERRFTSDAAHELRSPLAALKIQTEIAQLADDDAELRERALNNLTQGVDRATQLIEQLLTLSRLDNLKQLENLEDIHWEKLIPSLIGELYFHAEKRQIDLQFIEKNLPLVRQGQPLLLSMMLRNLIENAIKYCPQGSTVQIILDKDRIIVVDNGGGVEENDIAKLGQRFYRPAGQNEKGSGLGLSIVRRIAELHHFHQHLANSHDINGQKGLKATLFLPASR